jgi:hypothetical protein
MRRIALASLIVLAGFVRAAEVASSAMPATPPTSGSIETTADRQGTNPTAQRVVSPVTAAKLAAAAPKFTAPAPVPAPVQAPASPVAVARPAEPPRHSVIHLPEFVVGEPKDYVPTPLDVLTPKGRVELAFQRRPGLRIVPFRWMNAAIAVEMLEDDLQAERRREAAELWSLYLVR